ncbi:hypothetical protein [Marinoscillum furvescens]|uniref:Uncharacterized protein n=1 Tax=Marinoscillum furvescens DSM 4134 TaxID=1122208 RepID=A0A3D9KZL8_MARFU|nr:hypothetical protein [Marinoscillum furvescens]RED93871.1 hypothetical protein C7460_12351 [Marinoscillum furvescens DSM 4134]
MVKVVNFLKFLSIVLFLGILLMVYAYLPVQVSLETAPGGYQLHKETFFYYTITGFIVINIVLLAFQKLNEKRLSGDPLKAWMRGLGFVVNIYLTLIIGFIGVINNTTHLDPASFAYLNYLGPFLLVAWFVGLFYLVFSKR